MMQQSINYNEIFTRNVGYFSKIEIDRIKSLRVAIAGAGGLGGPVAYILARLGVGEIRIADPEEFEPTNINRQFGANIKTIGKNKALVVADEIALINPYMKVVCWDYGINENNVTEFLTNIDLVVDSIDFFKFLDARTLYREAEKNEQWIFTAQSAGSLFSVLIYKPGVTTFEKIFFENGKINIESAINKCFPIFPKEATPELLDEIIHGNVQYVSSYAALPPIGGGFLANEIIKVFVKRTNPTTIAPNLYIVDVDRMKITIFKNDSL